MNRDEPAHEGTIRGTLITTVLILASGVISGALLARLLGVYDRGVLAAILLWPTLIAYVGDLGVPAALAVLSARGTIQPARLASAGLSLAGVQSLLLIPVGLGLLSLTTHQYRGAFPIAAVYLATYVPLNLATRYLNAINQGSRRFAQFNTVRLTVQLLYVLGIGALFSLHSRSLPLVVTITVLSNVGAMCAVAVPFLMAHGTALTLDRAAISRTLGYGIRAHVGNLQPIDAVQADLAAVILLMGPSSAGLYAIALSSVTVIRASGVALGMVALPAVAAVTDQSARLTALARHFRLAVLFQLPSAIALFIAAPVLVPLVYGPAFAGAAGPVRILCVGALFAALRQVLGECLRGANAPIWATVSELAAIAVAIVGFPIFILAHGVTGAAIAASAAYATAFVVSVAAVVRLGVPLSDLLIVRRPDLRSALAVVLRTRSADPITTGTK